MLPGTCLRWVHLRAVSGGQMQFWRQLIAISSIGVMAGSLEYNNPELTDAALAQLVAHNHARADSPEVL